MSRTIYLDNAASTPTDPHVIRAVSAALRVHGNPSAFNAAGRAAAALLRDARHTVASFLHAHPTEIVFCASGSEANTLALLGAVGDPKGSHVVASAIEHRSVLECVARLKKRGAGVTIVSVDGDGVVDAEAVVAAITPQTRVVSVMYANNEVGSLQPVVRIGAALTRWRREHRSRYPLFHVDACQAAGYEDMNVQRLGADLLTFNGAKVHGPKGVGVLFVRRGVVLESQVLGGSQEGGRRAGTEDVAGIVGLAVAVQRLHAIVKPRVAALRDRLIAGILAAVPDARVNGPLGDRRLANNVNISILGAQSERLLLELDRCGISAGAGSACTAHSVEPSHVLRAMKIPKRFLGGALRFSLSKYTTAREVQEVVRVLPSVVARARRAQG
ncbi:MAG: cysteine desulfurase [Candidatus Yanofskybacteria bacterium]|nr:cysteine desulfurase [Candidatus Yanofskybacteria bacterium]